MCCYLGEVSHEVAACVVCLSHDIEQEGLHVVVQRLVVEEQLGQQTQILAVDLVLLAVYFKHRYGSLPVHFISRGMLPHTLGLVKTWTHR